MFPFVFEVPSDPAILSFASHQDASQVLYSFLLITYFLRSCLILRVILFVLFRCSNISLTEHPIFFTVPFCRSRQRSLPTLSFLNQDASLSVLFVPSLAMDGFGWSDLSLAVSVIGVT